MLCDVSDRKNGDADAPVFAGEAVIPNCHMQLVAVRLIFITQDTERREVKVDGGRGVGGRGEGWRKDYEK